ncbi:MAG: Cna B-type domain-containing protein, partial [Defluviitaleaceae bacterium]|nr:Cna B-type domain-containing protein [Defluviitaleaceae bacterium]
GGVFLNPLSVNTYYEMPGNNSIITAYYETIFTFGDHKAVLTVVNGTDGVNEIENKELAPNTRQNIVADLIAGKVFDHWYLYFEAGFSPYQGIIENIYSPNTGYYVGDGSITITAMYNDIQYTLNVIGGSGSGSYLFDEPVTITADPPAPRWAFSHWNVVSGGISIDLEEMENNFDMPSQNVTVEAVYEKVEFELTVIFGAGSGIFHSGYDAPISVDLPGSLQFIRWVVRSGGGTFGSAASAETVFTMANSDAVVEAIFENPSPPDPNDALTVSIVWSGYNPAGHPGSVFVQLYKNGLPEGPPVELNSGVSWKHTWDDLDPYEAWAVEEVDVPDGYKMEKTGVSGLYAIINTFLPTEAEITPAPTPGTDPFTPTPYPEPTGYPFIPIPTATPDPSPTRAPQPQPTPASSPTPGPTRSPSPMPTEIPKQTTDSGGDDDEDRPERNPGSEGLEGGENNDQNESGTSGGPHEPLLAALEEVVSKFPQGSKGDYSLSLKGDGAWFLIGKDGNPVGVFEYDRGTCEWRFEELIPHGELAMPKTGQTPLFVILFVFGAALLSAGFIRSAKKRAG